MEKNHRIRRCLTLLTVFAVLATGLLVSVPKEVSAFAELSQDGTCIQCHDDGRTGESEPTAESAQPATAEPVPVQPTQPAASAESAEPGKEAEGKEANSMLIAGGLVGVIIIIGVAVYLNKRGKR